MQCITNFVSMDFMANVLLAAGMSPAMAHCLDEVGAAAATARDDVIAPVCLEVVESVLLVAYVGQC